MTNSPNPTHSSRWVELRCTLPQIWADPVAEWLLDEWTSGVIVEEGDGEPSGPAGRVLLITALSNETDAESAVAELRALGRSLAARTGLDPDGALTVETRPITPEELEALLAPSFRPLEITPGLWVVPEDGTDAQEEIPSGAEAIRLIPALAFGTGTHPSTRLAARLAASWFDRWSGRDGPRVLDLGTGSGLLAIAAALWGAEQVFGIERDTVALDNARRNASLNDVGARVAFAAADLTAMEPRAWADLLLANLDRDHFAAGSESLAGWLAEGGAMVASGFRAEHEGLVLEAIEGAGLTVSERAEEGDWVAFLASHRP